MKGHFLIVTFLILVFNPSRMTAQELSKGKPNVIIIIADDLGFNDIGFHGSNQIPTPNIDALAYYGIALNRHYTAPMCTPSRGSLMTGKYPTKIGLQHYVIASDHPYGLGLEHKLFPQYMKDGGYTTHLIGKWHLGFYRKVYTPTMRGFDTHLGYLGPYIDYWDHSLKKQPFDNYELERGYDMRTNLNLNYTTRRIYATDLFTDFAVQTIKQRDKTKPMILVLSHLAPHSGNYDDPVQAPEADIRKFSYITNLERRTYAAMVSRLDDGIGKVVETLNQENILDNSVILFFSDNGSPIEGEHSNGGSNAPLRGQKESPYEGAIRTVAAIWSPLLKSQQRVSNQLIHITDWLPTFVGLAGINVTDENMDGKNIWDALSYNTESPRTDVLANIDVEVPYVSYLNGYWKYVNGINSNGIYDKWMGDYENEDNQAIVNNVEYANRVLSSQTAILLSKYRSINQIDIETLRNQAIVRCNRIANPIACKPLVSECLFDLRVDPCETNNLALERPNIISMIKSNLQTYYQSTVQPRNKPGDPRSNPIYFNNTWTWWFDELNINEDNSASGLFSFKISAILFAINTLVLMICGGF